MSHERGSEPGRGLVDQREAALEKQLAEKEKEITTVKSRNYDLLKQVDELTQVTGGV